MITQANAAREAARERLQHLDRSELKAMLLAHVRRCTSRSCPTCVLLRIRVWCLKHPLHRSLLDDEDGSFPGDSSADITNLLRSGVDIHKTILLPPNRRRPTLHRYATAVDLARALQAKGQAPVQSPAWKVLRAAEPWSEQTHHLFPASKRDRAVTLLFLGYALCHSGRFAGQELPLLDVWLTIVMPYAL